MTRERLLKGFVSRGIGQGVTIIVRLVEVPLMFHFWGVDLYGEWLILIAIPAYLSMSDFGFGSVTARHMTMLVASGRREEALGAFQSSHLLVSATSFVVAALLVVGVWSWEATGLFSLNLMSSGDALAVMSLFSLRMMVVLQNQLSFGGLQCEGKYPLGLLLLAATDFLEFLGLAGAVALGAQPAVAAAAALAGVICGGFLFHLAMRLEVPWLAFGWRYASFEQIRELWRPALSAMALPLGQALSFQGPRLIIGALLGPAAVAIFVAHRQLMRFGTLVLGFAAPLQAELAMVFGRGDQPAFQRLAFRSSQLMIWMSFAALAFAATLGLWLFGLWTSGRLEVQLPLLLVLAAATFGEAAWRSVFLPIMAINRHMRGALSYLIVSVVVLVPALYFLTSAYALIGAAVALGLAEVSMFMVAAYQSRHLFQVGWPVWLVETARPPVWILREGYRFLAMRKAPVEQAGEGGSRPIE